MRRLRYSVPYIAGKNLPKDSDPAPCGAGRSSSRASGSWRHFNPPAPCGAGREYEAWMNSEEAFQSTRPLRGGTPMGWHPGCFWGNFNPPAPCGAGPVARRDLKAIIHFNPPAPCGAGLVELCRSDPGDNFNPPAPCGAGRAGIQLRAVAGAISIHPPLVGRDPALSGILKQ